MHDRVSPDASARLQGPPSALLSGCDTWGELAPSAPQGTLSHPEVLVAVEMLSSVVLMNEAMDAGDRAALWKQLASPVTGLGNVEDEYAQRYVAASTAPPPPPPPHHPPHPSFPARCVALGLVGVDRGGAACGTGGGAGSAGNRKVAGSIPGSSSSSSSSSQLAVEVSLSKTPSPLTAPDQPAVALRGRLRRPCVSVCLNQRGSLWPKASAQCPECRRSRGFGIQGHSEDEAEEPLKRTIKSPCIEQKDVACVQI